MECILCHVETILIEGCGTNGHGDYAGSRPTHGVREEWGSTGLYYCPKCFVETKSIFQSTRYWCDVYFNDNSNGYNILKKDLTKSLK